MAVDLEWILVVGTGLTGAIWLLDLAVLRRRRQAKLAAAGRQAAHDPWYVEYARSFFPVLLVVLVLRGFVAEPFRIPSGSMMPTLLVGDFILVSKFSYGVHLPITRTRIIETGSPERGDVAVFKYPQNPREDYIKRIVGLPGDVIGFYDKALYINGEPMPQELIESYVGTGSGEGMSGADLIIEQIGDKRFETLAWPGRRAVEGEVRVPEGMYFALGDNRDNSNDSRFWGFVPEANLVGRATRIWMHWDFDAREMQWSRIGQRIQ
ncbi:signal peptidase I Serine peptidase. MEROPS family S26A [Ectothiorhodosinus mongolicus]|uniref:Signal peptidase I n=1 Tax=Ectothiorhodosinus mongolicus TaxID=233100 RepID=A0A1R3VMY6_9GAMM|nr:signal peptidase I [Ectothiorhodosinus mongolicus]ULX56379.1 signal peptidase I [Ectothiorhodosinus mongolicus]SIT65897.1 signal peptidase I Serine peptidase. MEROPS family S26A [Ectothiorhodosinus mongolicus]